MSKISVKRTGNALLTTLCLLLASQGASAIQLVEGKDGDTLTAKVSIKENTRIAVSGGRIKQFISTEGELIKEKDDDNGQLFVRPLVEGFKPINAFLVDDKGNTFTLILQPTDIPADSILVKEKGNPADQARAEVEKAGSYERVLKNFLLAMVNGEGKGVDVESRGKTIPLWNEAWFVLQQVFKSGSIVGEKYRLVNKSEKEMVLIEQEFFRDGVAGVAIEKHNLAPGEATWVYVMRGRGENE